jgi:uncharacterized membrane protein YgaE (UPF0421/DUF939 family)
MGAGPVTDKPRYETVIRTGLSYGVGAALVAVFAYATASRFPFLHEAYWAAIASIVSLCPEREQTVKAGAQQFFGSAVGGLIGWASAAWWHHNLFLYGAAVLLAVALCYAVRLPSAARLAGVAVTVITILPLRGSPGAVALHRFIEVSYGVVCALAYTAAADFIARLRRRRRAGG